MTGPARIFPAVLLESTRDDDWREKAECRDIDVTPDRDPFFTFDGERETLGRWDEARAICGGCPVRDLCLRDALAHRDFEGFRGGATGEERLRIIRRRTKCRTEAAS